LDLDLDKVRRVKDATATSLWRELLSFGTKS